ncbi:MAG: N-acetylmuramoyl-L-alanine amidase [Gammaproteobacteria bacterium]
MQLHSSANTKFSRSTRFVRSGIGLLKLSTCFSLVLLLLLSYSSFSATNIAKISDVRIADRASNTRIVFDLTSPVKHSVFVLKNPDRVVLDIDQCDANDKLKASRVGGVLVKEVRYAQKTSEKLRVVFDLNSAVSPKSFLLPPSDGKAYRLVIDLTSSTALASTSAVSATKATTSSEVSTPRLEPVIAMKDPQAGYRDIVVAIDAGHGGKDPGAIGRGGTREKDIVLSISKRLKNLIDNEPGMRAHMTRSGDTFIPLRGRIKKASQQNADIFISIHADAAHNRKAKGSSVYVLSQNGATSEAARILAKRENASDKIGGVSLENKDDVLKSVLVDLSQTATIDASIDLAEDILLELGQVGNILRDKVEQAGFAVLKSPDIPSVLVETAFISNPQEEKRLKTASHQQKLAVAILKGLRRYTKDHSPPNAILASNQTSINSHATYTIKSGDTLSGIAIRHQVSLVDLRRVNNLRSDKLRVGQVLKLPATVTAGT